MHETETNDSGRPELDCRRTDKCFRCEAREPWGCNRGKEIMGNFFRGRFEETPVRARVVRSRDLFLTKILVLGGNNRQKALVFFLMMSSSDTTHSSTQHCCAPLASDDATCFATAAAAAATALGWSLHDIQRGWREPDASSIHADDFLHVSGPAASPSDASSGRR